MLMILLTASPKTVQKQEKQEKTGEVRPSLKRNGLGGMAFYKEVGDGITKNTSQRRQTDLLKKTEVNSPMEVVDLFFFISPTNSMHLRATFYKVKRVLRDN